MDKALEERLRAVGNLPSPPKVAMQVLELARRPDVSLAEVAAALAYDPALSAKLLRLANSPLYAQRRSCRNLRQALTVVGVEAAVMLCLGFSIAGSFRPHAAGTLDYSTFWRRSLLGALASRCVGEELAMRASEELFLIGLLQDIGILVLDRAMPDFYARLRPAAIDAEFREYEHARLQDDHAAVGAWFLRTWNFPEELCRAVAHSHAPGEEDANSPAGRFARCIAVGTDLAAALTCENAGATLAHAQRRGQAFLDLTNSQFSQILGRTLELAPDLSLLFDTTLVTPEGALRMAEEAQELLAGRAVELVHGLEVLRQETRTLVEHSTALEDANRRDPLTGLHNRRYLDERLAAECAAAMTGGWELSLLFIDLDAFKAINDRFGHQAGDQVLHDTAQVIQKTLRTTDLAGRYGGDEFLVMLPGTSRAEAEMIADRIRQTLSRHRHRQGESEVVVTASIGLAVQSEDSRHADPASLIAAADQVMRTVKNRSRLTHLDSGGGRRAGARR